MNRTVVTCIALAIGLCAAFAGGSYAQTMPAIEMKSLDGKTVNWPRELPAERTAVILAYERNQQADVEAWVQELGLPSDGPYAQVLVLGRGASLARSFIDGGLRSAFDDATEARTFTLYVRPETLNGPLGIATTQAVTVLLVDRSGRIIMRHEGAPTAAAVAAVRSAL